MIDFVGAVLLGRFYNPLRNPMAYVNAVGIATNKINANGFGIVNVL